MAHAFPRAESDIALDVKSVLQNELRLAEQKFGAFEKRWIPDSKLSKNG
jgi:hypothetical protein